MEGLNSLPFIFETNDHLNVTKLLYFKKGIHRQYFKISKIATFYSELQVNW